MTSKAYKVIMIHQNLPQLSCLLKILLKKKSKSHYAHITLKGITGGEIGKNRSNISTVC